MIDTAARRALRALAKELNAQHECTYYETLVQFELSAEEPVAPPVESEEGLTPAEAAECASRVQRHEPLGLSAADHDQLIQKLRRIAGREK